MLQPVIKKFEALEYPLISFSCKFFITIFTELLPEEVSLRVLDLFFLTGRQTDKIIFDVSLAYLRILEK